MLLFCYNQSLHTWWNYTMIPVSDDTHITSIATYYSWSTNCLLQSTNHFLQQMNQSMICQEDQLKYCLSSYSVLFTDLYKLSVVVVAVFLLLLLLSFLCTSLSRHFRKQIPTTIRPTPIQSSFSVVDVYSDLWASRMWYNTCLKFTRDGLPSFFYAS